MGDAADLTMTVYVTRVQRQGSLTVGLGHDEAGKPVVFAGNSRIMREVQDRLEQGEKSVPVAAILIAPGAQRWLTSANAGRWPAPSESANS